MAVEESLDFIGSGYQRKAGGRKATESITENNPIIMIHNRYRMKLSILGIDLFFEKKKVINPIRSKREKVI